MDDATILRRSVDVEAEMVAMMNKLIGAVQKQRVGRLREVYRNRVRRRGRK